MDGCTMYVSTLTQHFTKYHSELWMAPAPNNHPTQSDNINHAISKSQPHHTEPKKQNNRIGQASPSHAKLKAKHWHENIVKRAAWFAVHVCPRDENYVKYSLETKIVYSIFVIARRILHTHINRMNMTLQVSRVYVFCFTNINKFCGFCATKALFRNFSFSVLMFMLLLLLLLLKVLMDFFLLVRSFRHR